MQANNLPSEMLCYPTVFAVTDAYQIFVPFLSPALFKVTVGGVDYFDECNGVLRSNTLMHSVEIPKTELDKHGRYTVKYRKVIERKPYFPTSEEEVEFESKFNPVPSDGNINLYHIADAHNLVKEPVAAGGYFGDDLHLLVLNGDIPNHSGDIKNFNAICEIASGITKGLVPCICARGNHDTRGLHAEDMPQYIPTVNGKTYYTVRLGSVWALILDCGEDKPDSSTEYGGTVCFHDFRIKETEFIKKVIENSKDEYEADGIEHRLVICHNPFTFVHVPPFDIEVEFYTEWARLLRENVKPDLLLCGHKHVTEVCEVDGERDHLGQPCTMIIGSKPKLDEPYGFTGCAVTLKNGHAKVVFNDDQGNVAGKSEIELR